MRVPMRSSALFLRRISPRWLQKCSITQQLTTPSALAVGPSVRDALKSARNSNTCAWSTPTSIICIQDAMQGVHWQKQHEVMHRAHLHSTAPGRAAQSARADRTSEASTSKPASQKGGEAMQKLVRQRTMGGRVQMPPTMQQGMTHITAPLSPNMLAEPYKGDLPPLPWGSLLTVQGYRDRWKRFIGAAKSMYTLAKCRKYVPGFGLPAFKADALRLYEDACSGIARSDRTLLRQIMTPAEYGNFKAQLKAREDGDWKRVEWSLARRPLLHELEVVHGRMIAPNPKDEQSAYAQLTVRIRALHKFAAYSGKGELKAGSPGKDFPVLDVWILERAFKKGPTSRWRIAGRLSLPPVPPTKGSWWNPMTWVRMLGPSASASMREKPKLEAKPA
ncbi:hypothetical protein CVIRNUC_010070 [Coccomyxa viridis]|uniref:Large ribosomal subunit protein mL45 n=1 Tax=Coccomyxa viridis TaxID=1274662 RepID=A0AAV1IHN8_9CHLO|nr:hypothetical protein CVIRNUC_010070 [Coccomyxa viridis]